MSRFLRAAVATAAASSALAAAATFYVSTTGSDAGAGTASAPFATLQHAFTAVAALRAANNGTLPSDVDILLGSGSYYTASTVTVDASQGGDSAHVVTVSPWSGGSVVISGGQAVTGWQLLPGTSDVFTAVIPTSQFPGPQVRALYGAGGTARRPLQRVGYLHYSNITYEADATYVQVPVGTFPVGFASQLDDAFAYVYHSWTSSLSRVAAWGDNNNTLTLAGVVGDHFDTASGNRFSLANIADAGALEPGNFLWVSANRTVVYRVLPGEQPWLPGQEIVVPVLGTVLSVAGADAASNAVQNVVFANITFAHSADDLDAQCISAGCCSQSGSDLEGAAVQVANATAIQFQGVTVAHTGGYGIWLHAGTTNSAVSGCSVHDLGAGGIRIGEAISGTASNPLYLATGIIVEDTYIYDSGYIVEAGTGILMQQASGCHLQHNDIHDLYYTGISAGWTWGYAPTSSTGHYVGYNNIYNIGRQRLSDFGCIYHLGVDPGTLFTNNVCFNSTSYGYGGWGYYDDEGTSNVTWQFNIVYATKSAGLHQHYGENNVIVNNVIADPGLIPCDGAAGCDNAAVRSSQHPPHQDPGSNSSFTFARNIVLLSNAYSTLFYTTMPTGMVNMTLSNNVYWSSAAAPSTLTFPPTQDPTTWAQWTAEGKDAGSIVADPQFVDASGFDFSHLQPTSPALARGFVPIDTSTVGPRVPEPSH